MMKQGGTWKNRRRFMLICTAFFMWVIAYALIKNLESEVAENAVIFSCIGITGIIGSYVFGATWEDINRNR